MHQPSLFGDEPAPWEADDAEDHVVASVVFSSGPSQEFDYLAPEGLREHVEPGRRVRVPFGRGSRMMQGYCVRVERRSLRSPRLKEVAEVMDEACLLDAAMLRLTEWIAGYYLCGWGQVLESVIPAGVRGGAGTRKALVLRLADGVAAELDAIKLPKKQSEVLKFVAASPEGVEASVVAASIGCTQAPIKSLRDRGLLLGEQRRVARQRMAEPAPQRESHLTLNDDQQAALQAVLEPLDARRHETVLLHGVTGSGKTEVYIQAIEHVLQFGRQAIVLVPEISLTPQTRQRFRARFGDVAVLHSHLSDADRHWQWERIARGEVSVVIGARSAVFAPTRNLGLIVIDEEHEPSFKQDSTPRYHAREVALRRASELNVPLVLGSATPSLESWHKARRGDYRFIRLPSRVLGRPMPRVGTIDLRNEGERFYRGAISRPLSQAMEQSLGEGGQVMLFLNRRGFNTHIQCPACGAVARCPGCDLALTHHRQGEIALCHYCDYAVPAPSACAECRFTGIRYSGLGTQRLEAEVKSRFPQHACLRMDTDSMKRPGSHERALNKFRDGEVRILLGTQMIAKGLDFPGVTLVGVINADTALHFPDFRAAERTFQLIVQVAGRTGRGEKGGRVLVQSLSPEHPAIAHAAGHDYTAFAAGELPIRELLSYPPFGHLIRIVARGPQEAATKKFLEHLAEEIKTLLAKSSPASRILGPAPCPLPKLRGNHRFQLQLQSPDGEALRQAVRKAGTQVTPPKKVLWTADVDAVDMM